MIFVSLKLIDTIMIECVMKITFGVLKNVEKDDVLKKNSRLRIKICNRFPI